ncbi:MAG: cell division protein SepF [Clostridiales bacterium]|nr:cell division protein SepF [Clostridiales bacterium]MDD7347965.1 cell division protein SepF [Clostridiales bacterium]MDY4060781.1 cell division protein SepF [Anaerovoracaceae bacterium]
MGFSDSIKKFIGIEEEEVYVPEEEVAAAREDILSSKGRESMERKSLTETISTSNPYKNSSKRFSTANTSAFKLVVIEPKSFDECPRLVDSLMSKRPIIVNLEKLDQELGRKIFDFLNGATYALKGNVRKVTNSIFIFTPSNVDINGEDPSGDADFGFEPKDKNPWR